MIDFHTWSTPNGRKVAIMLEEAAIDYRVFPVDISAGRQFDPAFLAISPNNKIPAIVDHDVTDPATGQPLVLFESGAILIHLAEKTGRFLPQDAAARAATLKWLFWQVGGFGPMLGQFNHFLARREEAGPYALKRFTDEALRLFGVLDRQLDGRDHVAGAYSIADMAIHPWSLYVRPKLEAETGQVFENVKGWEQRLLLRPAIGRAQGIPATPAH